jgi:hypothetical protein
VLRIPSRILTRPVRRAGVQLPGTTGIPPTLLRNWCHHLTVGTPETASRLIRQSARALSSGGGSVAGLRSTLLSNLHDLCRNHPLEGDYLNLFEALGHWEASVGADHKEAESYIKTVADRLAAE